MLDRKLWQAQIVRGEGCTHGNTPSADVVYLHATSFIIIYVFVKTCHNFAADLNILLIFCMLWLGSAWLTLVKIN